ncbi:PREDICTED: uncharacterized protein LOC104815083 [Tarenaya hassleriana]|uniref:uncharacterized protein LOC104815083 n=1 Tax=Tarenaya hassleriana TaxID=28532 RepID=UPI00053C518A|nr:PREDICTED: uncharacterized protein LOC104815083 [Tarenaya hassleriana]XP_010541697.1 PREDICTED: uncharacterized protein LOC104815083 [Tarenaya hassleriana]XP_010541698.1 PREDICTED: uncharacterized protein LOC104815083 [Tarenaya hassleriana]
MRRQGNFAEPVASAFLAGQQIQNQSSQRMDHNTHSDFQGQLEAFTPEREQPYSDSQADGQWRWEREGPNMSSRLMTSSIYNEAQAVDSSRSYYRNQMEPKVGMEKQGSDLRAQSLQEDPNIGYVQTFEGLEQKFMDDITRLAKEQIEAEDAEIARHREKINTINARYQEQLDALRARHAAKRDEILRKESQSRQQKYNQQAIAVMKEEQYQREPMPPVHPHSYIGNVQDPVAVVADAPSRPYGSDQFAERARFQGGTRDRGFNSRGQFPGGGNVYDSGSRFY